jgi:ribonuclease HI
MVKAYCDASFNERLNMAGIGILIQDGQHERNFYLFTKAPSNNWAELFAIKMAGILTHNQAEIYTDSQTAIQYINRQIGEKERSKKQYIIHKQCELLAWEIRAQNLPIEKIKAHTHNFQLHSMGNRMADLNAKRGLAKYYAMGKGR